MIRTIEVYVDGVPELRIKSTDVDVDLRGIEATLTFLRAVREGRKFTNKEIYGVDDPHRMVSCPPKPRAWQWLQKQAGSVAVSEQNLQRTTATLRRLLQAEARERGDTVIESRIELRFDEIPCQPVGYVFALAAANKYTEELLLLSKQQT